MICFRCKVNFTIYLIQICISILIRKLVLAIELGRRCILKNKIENIRKEKGIRQEEFAKAMGVSRQTISSLENGRYNPSILLAYKIAKYFDMSIEEVFIFEETEL